jgi:hypothetical protein
VFLLPKNTLKTLVYTLTLKLILLVLRNDIWKLTIAAMRKSTYRLTENLSGMKRLRTVNGFKYIATNKRKEIEDQVQALVTMHKARLIENVLIGIPQYVDYKFHQKINSVQKEELTRTLKQLQKEAVSIDDCEPLVEELMQKEEAVVESTPFYYEIDQKIKHQLWKA